MLLRHMILLLASLSTGLALTSCNSAPDSAAPAIADAASTAQDEATLVAAGARWSELFSERDWVAMRALYEDDAWLMTNNAPALRDADAIVEYLRGVGETEADITFAFEPEDVVVERPYGFVTAQYWMMVEAEGAEPLTIAGRSLLIYKYRDGEWRLWRDIDNSAPDVPASPPQS